MSDRWYWKKRGQVVGPLTTEELHEHILHRRVADGDAFRLDETDEWLSAAQIKAIFREQSGGWHGRCVRFFRLPFRVLSFSSFHRAGCDC